MSGWQLLGYWVIAWVGFLWVQRVTRGDLRCHWLSGAIAAAGLVVWQMAVGKLVGAHREHWALVALLLLTSQQIGTLLTVIGAHLVLPGFRLQSLGSWLPCSLLLLAWTWIIALVFSWLQLLAGLLLAWVVFGGQY